MWWPNEEKKTATVKFNGIKSDAIESNGDDDDDGEGGKKHNFAHSHSKKQHGISCFFYSDVPLKVLPHTSCLIITYFSLT